MHKGPLLFEGILQACVCGLWVLTRHPRHLLDPSCPVLHLISHPLHLWFGIPYISPHVHAPYDNGHALPAEISLRPRDIMPEQDQDTLGRIQELSIGGFLIRGCVTFGCASLSSLIKGRTPRLYAIIVINFKIVYK